MKKAIAPFGIGAVVLGFLIQGAEAKKVDYEIDGQRYSYELTNREQVEIARKRIEAANAANAAKARADAKRASDPIAAVFGSQLDREAEQAQANLKRLIAEQEQSAAEAKRRQAAQAAKKSQRPDAITADQKEPEVAQRGQPGAETASAALSGPAAGDVADNPPPAPLKLKSVFFDFESGIKTTVMGDGALHEEPFDPAALSGLITENGNLRAAHRNPNDVAVTGSNLRGKSQ